MDRLRELALAYRLRWKRRRLLYRSFRKRRQIAVVMDRTAQIADTDILACSTMRNEMVRLPHFLDYHRKLGVNHFLIVENDSDDGTRDYLAKQLDVSLWTTPASYKLSRFGVDWLTWLQCKYAHGHWCLTVDADEILIYPHHDTRPLQALVDWLDRQADAVRVGSDRRPAGGARRGAAGMGGGRRCRRHSVNRSLDCAVAGSGSDNHGLEGAALVPRRRGRCSNVRPVGQRRSDHLAERRGRRWLGTSRRRTSRL